MLPVAGLRRASSRVFARFGSDCLGYGSAGGPGPLVEWICHRLGQIDQRSPATDSVVVSAGNSHALEQLATLLTVPGDVVLVEAPTYHLAVRILQDHPVDIVPVPTDVDGLELNALEHTVKRLRRRHLSVRLLYTVPTFHNPTGVSLAGDRRRQLVRMAEAWGILIIEDDAYRELSYGDPAPPSLWSVGTPGTVVRLGTFAKSLA
ncbi:MAG: aminotransferase class I/II-fold pyridoxal phosphate-dependent enzyme, partial [Solirubrobacteraceae bacterium]